jgi:hypothetical protein
MDFSNRLASLKVDSSRPIFDANFKNGAKFEQGWVFFEKRSSLRYVEGLSVLREGQTDG